ncbi:MAG: hypothetical protein QM680_00070 [Luteolibacter sp.]
MMKKFLFLSLLLAVFAHAETEDEFIVRVKAAWESKDADKVIALHDFPERIDQKSERQMLEIGFKNRTLTKATVLRFCPLPKPTLVSNGKISQFPPSANQSIYLEFTNREASLIPILQDSEGKFWFATSQDRFFAWSGPKLDQFTVRINGENSKTPCPEVIAVVETCGYTSWKTVRDSGSFFAHKIQQLIVPPTIDMETITFKINKIGPAPDFLSEPPIFQKTVNTSKGAIVPIDTP